MLRVQQLLIPAVLLGCLTVIFLTNLVFQPNKAAAASLSGQFTNSDPGSGFLAVLDLHTTVENPPPNHASSKAAVKSKPKLTKSSNPSKSASSNTSSQADSSSDCSVASSYPQTVRQWCNLIDPYARAQNLDPNLIAAVILQESGGNPLAYSSSGAVGLMQVMPRDGLAAGFTCGSSPCFSSRPGMHELYDPEFNISYGSRMLGSLYGKYGGLRDALLAYGPANVGYYYADIVLDIYDRYK
jgi:hypothetical protein